MAGQPTDMSCVEEFMGKAIVVHSRSLSAADIMHCENLCDVVRYLDIYAATNKRNLSEKIISPQVMGEWAHAHMQVDVLRIGKHHHLGSQVCTAMKLASIPLLYGLFVEHRWQSISADTLQKAVDIHPMAKVRQYLYLYAQMFGSHSDLLAFGASSRATSHHSFLIRTLVASEIMVVYVALSVLLVQSIDDAYAWGVAILLAGLWAMSIVYLTNAGVRMVKSAYAERFVRQFALDHNQALYDMDKLRALVQMVYALQEAAESVV